MAHEIEMNGNEGSFAYRREGGAPWHRLGVALDGHQPLGEMLRAAHADYVVEKVPLFVLDPRSGDPVPVEGQFATARVNPFTDAYQPLGAVKSRYTVLQNEETLRLALEVVGASKGDAVFDTAGVLNDGRQFFATLDLGTLVIDPAGVADEIARYLVVRSSHDGSVALTFSNTDVRAVCKNTCILGEQRAVRVFRAKHTPNMEGRMSTAREVLRISSAWADEFVRAANEMLSISMTASKFDRVVEMVLPDDADTDRKRKKRDEQVLLLKSIYAGPTNAGKVGFNGWAAWNAVVEYFDHFRPGSELERALTSMDDSSWVSRSKLLAEQVVLSLA